MSGRTRKQSAKQPAITLDGALWMSAGDQPLGGSQRVELLQAIAVHGSITQAAIAVGMSYKAAWDAVDTMNTLAGRPLVERSTGGRGGGSTRLTARGQQLVQRFAQIAAVHQRFVRMISDAAIDLSGDFNLLRMLNLKTSARNQFIGTVSGYKAGSVNDEVELTLPGGARIVAIVTRASTELLQLTLGATAFALVKASSIIVATELGDARLSARNQLPGVVSALTPGVVNAEVVIDLAGGASLAAVVTQGSVQSLGLAPGQAVTAVFKASSVILGALA